MANVNEKKRLKAGKSNLLSPKLKNVGSACHENIFSTKDYFEILPDELTLHIFSFLPNCEVLLSHCSQVCKRWKILSIDNSLWRNVSLNNKELHVEKLKKIICFGVRRLNLTNCKIVENDDQTLKNENQDTVKYNLQHLYIDSTTMSKDLLINLIANSLYLTVISFRWQILDDAICKHIAVKENLITLDLHACIGIMTAPGMSEIFRRCANIQTINFPISIFSERDFTFVLNAVCTPSAIKFIKLGSSSVSDKHIQQISEHCPNLIKLDLMRCVNLTSSSIKVITGGLSKLQHLSLSNTDNIQPEALLQLRNLRNLTNLEIFFEFKKSPFPKEIKEKLEKALSHVKISELLSNPILQ